MTYMKESSFVVADIGALHKELDEISCPICMDHPHNAVLLICSSHEKGCRSYLCDTSYRHSNCLDRFKKLRLNQNENSSQLGPSFHESSHTENLGLDTLRSQATPMTRNLNQHSLDDSVSPGSIHRFEEDNNVVPFTSMEVEGVATGRVELGYHNAPESSGLKCPLCRTSVLYWIVVKEARQYLDQKIRICSRESCSFSGNYKELRRHARRSHPATRPAEINQSRQRAWRRLEHQREHDDILSAIRSTVPGAIVLGDYVIENGDRPLHDRESNESAEGTGSWLTTFFLYMISSPSRSHEDPRGSMAWRRHRRSRQRNLWGENLSRLRDEDDENLDDDIPIPRRRRRFTRSRTDDEQH